MVDAATPVNVLTGFLGSGKTTLLRSLLRAPAFQDTAVLVNEFGEIGLDHHLLEPLGEEVVLLQSGCLCCTIRGDLGGAIRDLHSRRERGSVPWFRRIVLETTGLAEPAPIISTILSEPVIRHHFGLGNVICTIDAVNGPGHLDRQPESLKQVAAADRIVITKTDIAENLAVGALRERLASLNPTASLLLSDNADIGAELLLEQDLNDARDQPVMARRWLGMGERATVDNGHHDHDEAHHHDGQIVSFALVFDHPLDWTMFGIWLTMLLHSHGEDILRVKGILNVEEVPTPVAIHGVQHLVHPPIHLRAWPDDERRSRIVFITRGIPRSAIERSLAAFSRLVPSGMVVPGGSIEK